MGTRCITVIKDEDNEEICVLYRQFDGSLDAHGKDLVDFLRDKKMVNGMGADKTNIANGMGCLAAQIIAHFKTEPGNFYLYPAGTRDCGEEYVYTISPYGIGVKDGEQMMELHLRVQEGMVTSFGEPGTPQKEMPLLYDGPVNKFDPESVC